MFVRNDNLILERETYVVSALNIPRTQLTGRLGNRFLLGILVSLSSAWSGVASAELEPFDCYQTSRVLISCTGEIVAETDVLVFRLVPGHPKDPFCEPMPCDKGIVECTLDCSDYIDKSASVCEGLTDFILTHLCDCLSEQAPDLFRCVPDAKDPNAIFIQSATSFHCCLAFGSLRLEGFGHPLDNCPIFNLCDGVHGNETSNPDLFTGGLGFECEMIDCGEPTPTPTESETSTETATETVTETATVTETPTGTATETATSTETTAPSSTPTSTLTESPTSTETATSTVTETATSSPSPSPTVTETATATATPSSTVTETATSTPSPSSTVTETATSTPSPSSTVTETVTPTSTATSTVTETASATPSVTSTATPSETVTETSTSTPTSTETETSTATSTPTPTASNTAPPVICSTTFSFTCPEVFSTKPGEFCLRLHEFPKSDKACDPVDCSTRDAYLACTILCPDLSGETKPTCLTFHTLLADQLLACFASYPGLGVYVHAITDETLVLRVDAPFPCSWCVASDELGHPCDGNSGIGLGDCGPVSLCGGMSLDAVTQNCHPLAPVCDRNGDGMVNEKDLLGYLLQRQDAAKGFVTYPSCVYPVDLFSYSLQWCGQP